MAAYQQRLLKRFGYSDKRGCGKAELCPAFSLPDLFGGDDGKGKITSQAQVDELLDVVPAYFSQSVITRDRKTATMAFGIRLMPLDRQKEVLEIMRSELHPPKGVSAQLAGLPVLAADANAAVSSSWRRLLTLVLGLLAVGAVLLVAFRSWRRALTPLVPIALATGWSALVLFATRVPLNPMSVTLGALVIAISTEFSVLLAERYRTERRGGLDPAAALERTYRSTGAAVLASGVTAIAGFAVLTLSDIRMLRDFGAVTVIDLTVSLLGVLLVLPSALVLGERWRPADVRVARPRIPAPYGAAAEAAAAPSAAARREAGRVSGPLDFDDEHGEAPPRRSAAVGARPADRTPTTAPPPPSRRHPSGTPYLWVVGAAAVVLVSLLLLTTIRQGTDRGARGVPVGEVMPPFAVPDRAGADRRRRQHRQARR